MTVNSVSVTQPIELILPENAPEAFHLLAKPTGAICNLDCAYCFFLDKEVFYPGSKFRMSDEVLEQYIRQLIESHQVDQVNIAWQGGEPTLMGLDFYNKAVDLAEKYRRPGMTFLHTMQTNGTLLDDEWCEFLKEHNFLIGFTDYYAQQSCTAGRAAFITGQNPVRTGLTKVGIPGADLGLQAEDPTIAELLKNHGYVTGQFGKNHFGDRNEFLPTVHGFDEFYGNLYHLNAEDEPEQPDYPKDPAFRERFGPRGVLHSFATDVDDPTEDPRFGRVGKQTIEDTGPLTKKRMETIDDDITERTIEFIKKAHAEGVPFFIWWNATHMHLWTRYKEETLGKSGQGFYNDVMVEHDEQVGKLLDLLDELGIAEDTIVQYSTDNGPHYNTWPDAAITPWRSEKNSNWEGAYRVPCFVRWPGKFEAGKVLNGIVTHQEWLPTLLAAAGEPDTREKLLTGYQANGKDFKVHIDGYNLLPYLTGETDECPRDWFFYTNDDGKIVAIRYGDWKAVFAEQRAKRMQLWAEPFVDLRMPKIFNLRRDPFERADENSNSYWDWVVEHVFVVYPMQALAAEQLQSFLEFPPRQKPGAFNLDRVIEQTKQAADGSLR